MLTRVSTLEAEVKNHQSQAAASAKKVDEVQTIAEATKLKSNSELKLLKKKKNKVEPMNSSMV